MNTNLNYEITNNSNFILILSIVLPIIVSYFFNKFNSEREFHHRIKGKTRVEWIESMRKVISEFYECIYLILYDNTVNIKTLVKLRNYVETIYLYCPKDDENAKKYINGNENYDSNDLLNEKVETIFNDVECFYFNYCEPNNLNGNIEEEKSKKIEEIKSSIGYFTLFVRKRFRIEWKKSKDAK